MSRAIANQEINLVYSIQIGDLNLAQALVKYQVTTNAVDAIDSAFGSCKDLSGQKFLDCIIREGVLAKQIYNNAIDAVSDAGIPGGLSGLKNYLGSEITELQMPKKLTVQYFQQSKNLQDVIAHAFKSGYVRILKTIGYWLQWGVCNTIEASLLLSALVSPLALGLSLLPIQGRPIIGWLIGYFALWGIPLGYALVAGLGAWVVVWSHLEAIADAAFLGYLVIFAPSLAATIMTFNGIAIHQGVISNVNEIKNFVSEMLSFGTNILLKFSSVK